MLCTCYFAAVLFLYRFTGIGCSTTVYFLQILNQKLTILAYMIDNSMLVHSLTSLSKHPAGSR